MKTHHFTRIVAVTIMLMSLLAFECAARMPGKFFPPIGATGTTGKITLSYSNQRNK